MFYLTQLLTFFFKEPSIINFGVIVTVLSFKKPKPVWSLLEN